MTTKEILPLPESTYQLLLDAARAWPDGIATQWIPDLADHTLAQVPVDADISTLRLPIVGASPLPASVREDFAAHTGRRPPRSP